MQEVQVCLVEVECMVIERVERPIAMEARDRDTATDEAITPPKVIQFKLTHVKGMYVEGYFSLRNINIFLYIRL